MKDHKSKMYEMGRQLMAQGKMLIDMSEMSDYDEHKMDKPEEYQTEDNSDRSGRNKMLAAGLKNKGY